MELCEKYRPNTLVKTFVSDAVVKIKEWANNVKRDFDFSNRKIILLYGAAGVGKTSMARSLANDMKWQAFEYNMSENRTAKDIKKNVYPASHLVYCSDDTKERNVLILDEIDGLHWNSSDIMIKMIKETSIPIIMICNNLNKVDKNIHNLCEKIEVKFNTDQNVETILRDICKKESIVHTDNDLFAIIEASSGDVRQAINNLEANLINNKLCISNLVTREKRDDFDTFVVTQNILKGKKMSYTLSEVKNVHNIDLRYDDLIMWIFENMFNEASINKTSYEEIAQSCKCLSNAVHFLQYSRSDELYRLYLRYVPIYITCATTGCNIGSNKRVRYNFPNKFRAIKQRNSKVKNSILTKMSKVLLMRENSVNIKMFNLYLILFKNDPIAVSAHLNLDKNEIKLLVELCKMNPDELLFIYDKSREMIKRNEIQSATKDLDIDDNVSDEEIREMIAAEDKQYGKSIGSSFTKFDKKKKEVKVLEEQMNIDSFFE